MDFYQASRTHQLGHQSLHIICRRIKTIEQLPREGRKAHQPILRLAEIGNVKLTTNTEDAMYFAQGGYLVFSIQMMEN